MLHRTIMMGACLLLGLAACCPLTSDHPLGPPQDALYDARLDGAWRIASSQEEPGFVHLGKADGNRMQVLALEHKDNGRMEWAAFKVYVIARAGNHYLNIDLKDVGTEEARNHQGYVVVQYSLPDNDTLVLARMDLETVVAAIQAGKLSGEITYASSGPESAGNPAKKKPPIGAKAECARITDTSTNLSRFLSAANIHDLFVPYLTLKRIH